MFKWLIPLLLAATQAFGQNISCPTRPPGTNDNSCASTAFVQGVATPNAITGLTTDVVATGPGNVAATIQPGAVTAAKMATGAAAANVGTLGGQLSGTLPNPSLATNTVSNSNLAQAGANTVKGNFTGSTANENDNTMPSCSGVTTTGTSGLQYTTSGGTTAVGCNNNLANLTLADQVVTGGANVTSQSLATGNVTIDCGSRPLQFQTNGGAFTITAPSNDGSCILNSVNNASAGTITFTGFCAGSHGDTLDTTNGHIFSIFIWRINSNSCYRVAANQ